MYGLWQRHYCTFQAHGRETSLLQDMLLETHTEAIGKRGYELQF
jgi:hypothetical protein